jgi:hypothetical protein
VIIFALGFGSVFLSGLGFDVLSELGCFMRNWGGERVFIEYFSIFLGNLSEFLCFYQGFLDGKFEIFCFLRISKNFENVF